MNAILTPNSIKRPAQPVRNDLEIAVDKLASRVS